MPGAEGERQSSELRSCPGPAFSGPMSAVSPLGHALAGLVRSDVI